MTQTQLTRLSNGVRVVTVPMKERDSAGVAIWVKAGARAESNRLAGASHFLEHMLFKGTQKRTARQIKEAVEGVGGVLNAFTGEESTCYFAKLLVEHVSTALDVLSDMVNHATLDKTELEKERTVILEEIKMYRDLPSHQVHELLSELMWPRQPLGRPISGTPETVAKLSRKDLWDYMKHHYHPKNILVSASGVIDHEEFTAKAERYFPARSNQIETHFSASKIVQNHPQTRLLEKATEQTHLVIGFHGLSRFHPDRYKLGLLNVMLGANMSSRLFEEVREKRGLAYEIRSSCGFYQDAGYFAVSAGVETRKAPKAIAVILKELDKIAKQGVKEDELSRAKDYFLSQLCMSLEDTLDHLLWVGERVIDGGQLPDRQKIRSSIQSVTVDEIRTVAQKIFVASKMNLALIGPVDAKAQKQIKKGFALSHG